MITDRYPVLDDVAGEDYFHFRTRPEFQYGERFSAMAWEIAPSQDRDGDWRVHVYEIATDADGNYIERGEMDSRHDFPNLGAAIRFVFNDKPDNR